MPLTPRACPTVDPVRGKWIFSPLESVTGPRDREHRRRGPRWKWRRWRNSGGGTIEGYEGGGCKGIRLRIRNDKILTKRDSRARTHADLPLHARGLRTLARARDQAVSSKEKEKEGERRSSERGRWATSTKAQPKNSMPENKPGGALARWRTHSFFLEDARQPFARQNIFLTGIDKLLAPLLPPPPPDGWILFRVPRITLLYFHDLCSVDPALRNASGTRKRLPESDGRFSITGYVSLGIPRSISSLEHWVQDMEGNFPSNSFAD